MKPQPSPAGDPEIWAMLWRILRVARQLRRRRNKHWEKVQRFVRRYPDGHLLWALNYSQRPIGLHIMNNESECGYALCIPEYGNPEVSEDGQALWKLDRYRPTLNRRGKTLQRAWVDFLRTRGLEDLMEER